MERIFKYKIYYEDTDAGGVVYYATYLRFLERARTDFLELSNITAKKLYEEGIFFAVKYVEANYLKPIFYGEIIDISLNIIDVKKTSFTIEYKIYLKQTIVFKAKTVLVCIGKDFKIKRLPNEIKNFLLENTDSA